MQQIGPAATYGSNFEWSNLVAKSGELNWLKALLGITWILTIVAT